MPATGHRMGWVLALALLAAVLLWALAAGQFSIAPQQLWQSLLARATGTASPLSASAETVLWNIRLPRIAAGLAVGATLAAAGAAYQGMFRNPLVSPDILGVSAGAGLGAVLGIFLGWSMAAVQALAFGGGLAAVAVVVAISASVRRHYPVLVLVLAGIALGALLGAGIALVKTLADPNTQLPSITFWLMGGLSAVTLPELGATAPVMLCALLPLMLLRWRINLLGLPDEEALALGVPVARLRLLLVACATLGTAAAVSLAGIVGWVGLVVPHVARLLVGPNFVRLLPASALLGAGFVVAADTLARSATRIELPLGILTALVGAPFFLYLLSRTGRND
ncbi:iron ABC transporter permease [Delftia sp. JD2]|uniref:FecCD family ABC transporter permease n=1 Tax=Delftia sp. JD2 TaxID=469553 RepID=UPI000806A2E0|nr:iron ABC transporter permease [Delftia sp. JD2]OBY87187.1 iron ABC transporter permease [Delftia sp. JD2]